MTHENYYTVLGVRTSASVDEIRRAYRILARRYHPDVNPHRDTADRFKAVADAYAVLSDPEKRRSYDHELQNRQKDRFSNEINAYRRNQSGPSPRRAYERARAATQERRNSTAESQQPPPRQPESDAHVTDHVEDLLGGAVKRAKDWWGTFRSSSQGDARPSAGRRDSSTRLSVIEVSLTVAEAILGCRKAVEIVEPEGSRKVSVKIPPGVRPGSIVRLRGRSVPAEDLLVIVRVAYHPYLSIESRGLVIEVPVTVYEAINGASILTPTLDEQVMVKMPPGTQSGTELRIKGKGMLHSDGTRGDLFVRVMVQVPDAIGAVGLVEKAQELERYYGKQIRERLPRTLLSDDG